MQTTTTELRPSPCHVFFFMDGVPSYPGLHVYKEDHDLCLFQADELDGIRLGLATVFCGQGARTSPINIDRDDLYWSI